MITHLKFMSIPVRDQDRALKFYTEKLGFKVATDQEMGPGKRWIELRIGKADTRVVLFTMDGEEGRIGTRMNCSHRLRRCRGDLAPALRARRRIRRPAAETALGNLCDHEGLGRKQVRRRLGLSGARDRTISRSHRAVSSVGRAYRLHR